MKLQDRMKRSITLRKGVVVLRSDFVHMASDSQVGRVLAHLVADGVLIRVGYGAFAKARINQFTGRPSAAGNLEEIAAELFRRLGIAVSSGQWVAEYNKGQTTQIPATHIVNTGKRRISRKIAVGNRSITYENHFRRT